jgi:dienelactone hydrolase
VTDVRIAVDRQWIGGKFLVPPTIEASGPAVLFVHGWGGSQRQDLGNARRLIQLGFRCLTFNLRGHTRTRRQKETVSRAQNLADALAAYDLLASQKGVDGERIGVVGVSYGGYLAVLLTAERKVRWLALRVPALYKDQDFDRPKRQLNLDGDLPSYRRQRLAPSENRALADAARFTGDVLLVQSEHDDVIPSEVIENYRRAFTAARSVTHDVMRGADHGLSAAASRQQYGRLLAAWFRRTADRCPETHDR